jgi:hypothetical protein
MKFKGDGAAMTAGTVPFLDRGATNYVHGTQGHKSSLTTPFGDRPRALQHAGEMELSGRREDPLAAKHLIYPGSLQQLVRRHLHGSTLFVECVNG